MRSCAKAATSPIGCSCPSPHSERALIGVVADDGYVAGVSTRTVGRVAQELGLEGISKVTGEGAGEQSQRAREGLPHMPAEGRGAYMWLDALHVNSREDGRIANVAVIVATATND